MDGKPDPERLFQLAEPQAGYFTAVQAKVAGVFSPAPLLPHASWPIQADRPRHLWARARTRPLPVILWEIFKRTFLTERASDFASIQYIMQDLPEDARVFMMWDGQGYCYETRFAAGAAQSQWVILAKSDPARAPGHSAGGDGHHPPDVLER